MNEHAGIFFVFLSAMSLLCSCSSVQQYHESPVYETDHSQKFTTEPLVVKPSAPDTSSTPPALKKSFAFDVITSGAIARIDRDNPMDEVDEKYVWAALKSAPIPDARITLSPQQEERLLVEDFRLFNRYIILRSERIPRVQVALDGIVKFSKLSPNDRTLFGCREYYRQSLHLAALKLKLYEVLYVDEGKR